MALTIKKTSSLTAQNAKIEALGELTRETTKRLNCDLPVSLHTEFKIKVAQSPDVKDMKDAIEKLIRGFINDDITIK